MFSPRAAAPGERAVWTGAEPAVTVNPARALALSPLVVREIDVVRFQGQAWYRLRGAGGPAQQALAPAGAEEGAVLRALPDASITAALRALRPDAGAPVLERLTQYDNLYYSRDPAGAAGTSTRPLPVWRARWTDGVAVYVDPASTRLLLRADSGTPWQRVLYNGLHSFDFAPLMARPLLRTGLLVGLSLLGLALCVTACVMAWRVLAPKRRHNDRREA